MRPRLVTRSQMVQTPGVYMCEAKPGFYFWSTPAFCAVTPTSVPRLFWARANVLLTPEMFPECKLFYLVSMAVRTPAEPVFTEPQPENIGEDGLPGQELLKQAPR